MKPTVLDERIADRLLSGALTPDTTPAGYERVAELLGTARPAPAAMADAGREAATVAAMRAAIWHTPVPTPIGASPKRGFARLATPRIAAAAAALAVFGASAAAAATGSLPGPAQNAASTVLSKVGISVPTHHGQSDNNGNHGTGNNGNGAGSNGSGGEDGSKAATPGSHGQGTPAGEAGTTATTRLTGNDDFGLCNAAANNDGHSNASVFPSASTCTSVTHPGNADNSNGKSDEHKPTTTTTAAGSPTTDPGHKGSPPTSTPADTRVTQPNKPATTTTTSISTTVTTAGKGNGNGNGNGNANGSDNGNGPTANSGNANGPGSNSAKS